MLTPGRLIFIALASAAIVIAVAATPSRATLVLLAVLGALAFMPAVFARRHRRALSAVAIVSLAFLVGGLGIGDPRPVRPGDLFLLCAAVAWSVGVVWCAATHDGG